MTLLQELAPIIVAGITTVGAMFAIFYAARRYGKLGIAPAQLQLSETLEKTMTAQATEIASLTRQIKGLTGELSATRTELESLRRQNADLKETIADLAAQIRAQRRDQDYDREQRDRHRPE